ncbi:helix-turn-helix domain-containing protein [Streptomyces sp. NRRL S-350]|uniref:helix-turn-helix domain-containing protein n=1 Tax=Streptomyces sp. NRRL S-350 TaxID=1463902 RepID=UPI0004C084D2|nr:helix-turn-helix transcriptional regulator [Streptomyces sp. NRRL S-350]
MATTSSEQDYRRMRVGGILRRLREQCGMTLEVASAAAGIKIDRLSRLERGAVRIDVPVVRALLDVYGVDDRKVRAALEETVRSLTAPTWWQSYARSLHIALKNLLGLEETAGSVWTWQPLLIPGRLQAEEYSRALLHAGVGIVHDGIEQAETLVQVRQERQRRVTTPLTAVIGEAALRTPVGGAEVMRTQIRHLLAQDPDLVTLLVLPSERGAHVGLDSAFSVLDFPDGARVATIETLATTLYLDDEASLDTYAKAMAQITDLALDPSATRKFLEQLVRAA